MENERLQNLDLLERRVWELRDQISEGLARKGYGYINIVRNDKSMGVSALILHADGTWSVKFGDGGYQVKNPSLDLLLEKYASLGHPNFQQFEGQYKGKINGLLKSSEGDYHQKLLQFDQKFEREKAEYVGRNKLELLQGFIESMEKASKSLVK